MTPLVREMAALVPEPETAHWFDLGTVPSHVPAGRTAWDDIRHMPYPRTVAVFASDKGAKYACWIAAGQYSVTFAYLMAVPSGGARYSMALNITVEDGEMRYTTSDAHASDADRKDALRMLAITVQRLQTASAAYRPESIGTPAQQRKRAAKGKKPLFAWHTVTISATPKVAVATPDVAGTHASPRAHDRRGHWRIYKASGKRVWVKHCRVGNPADGVVFKDYRIRSEK